MKIHVPSRDFEPGVTKIRSILLQRSDSIILYFLELLTRVRTNSSNYSFFRIVRYRIVYSIRYSFSFQLTNTIRSFEKSANEYQIHILPIFKTVLVQNCPKIFNLNKYCAEICMFQLMLAIIFMFSLDILSVWHFCQKII